MTDAVFATLFHGILHFARTSPAAPALIDIEGDTIAYGQLLALMETIVARLDAAGVPRGSRVAALLHDGAATAAAFLGISSGFTFLPIHPALTAPEIETLLVHSRASALVCDDSIAFRPKTPVQVIAAGDLLAPRASAPAHATERDVALLMPTSGTTARPRLVPLTHRHLCVSAANIIRHFRLTPADRRLNVMPLVHVQGLVGGVVATLLSGGSVVCAPHFDPERFPEWLEAFRPTWYSAVPTMHREIVKRLARQPRDHALRFVRNGSFPLLPEEAAAIESILGVPVIESYGMTETASQIACNPLPPAARKYGTAGLAAGPEIAIRRADGSSAAAGEAGEIWVRGENVIDAYDDPGEETASFRDGWFFTGDIGVIGSDGFLTIAGRAKDMINCGGDKVAPREVESVLRRHPDVADAVVFGTPDERIGETVAAVVVLRPGARVTARALRLWAARSLAAFKVPHHLAFAAELPRGVTGKVIRRAVAEARVRAGQMTATQRTIAAIWRELLDADVSASDDFHASGGSSLLLAEMLARVGSAFGREVPLAAVLPDITVEHIAEVIDAGVPEEFQHLVLLRRGSPERPPLFCFHPAGGSILGYVGLVERLTMPETVYAIQAPGMEGNPENDASIEELAERYLPVLRSVQPRGPYRFLGHSLGGLIAFELAHRLREAGERVELLVMIDSMCPAAPYPRAHDALIGALMSTLERADLRDEIDAAAGEAMWTELFEGAGGAFLDPGAIGNPERCRELFLLCLEQFGFLPAGRKPDDLSLRRFLRALRAGYRAARAYAPRRLDAPLVYVRAGGVPEGCSDPALGWSELAAEVRVIAVDSQHFDLLSRGEVGKVVVGLALSRVFG